ncbi:MAG: hypothetical protein ACREJQ_04430, partial [bacterium]
QGDLQELDLEEEIVEAEIDGVPDEVLLCPGVIQSHEMGDRVLLEVFPNGWNSVQSKIVDAGGVVLTQSRKSLPMRELLGLV